MKKLSSTRIGALAAVLAVAAALGGCGGGGAGTDTVGSGSAGFVSGSVTKGPVSGAVVTAYGITGGQIGSQVGTTTTDASGNFTMNIGAYSGPLMMKVAGGSYTDEATGQMMSMAVGDVMTAMLPSVNAGSSAGGVQITPLTAMAQAMAQQMSGGMTAANITAANQAMGSYFGVSDILHVQPMNVLSPGSATGANQDSRNYGMTLAAMSQYAKTLGMATSSSLVTSMMGDASDGVMDGRQGGTPVSMSMGGMMGNVMMSASAGTSGLATAMGSMVSSSANRSGVTAADMAALMQQLSTSTGKI